MNEDPDEISGDIEIGLMPAQIELLECQSRYFSYFQGRRGGKSHGIAARVKTQCLGIPGFRFVYIAPFNVQCDDFVEEFMTGAELSPYVRKTRTRPFKMFFHNGSYFTARSFERPRSIRGRGYNEVAFDEIADIGPRAKQFWPVIRPLISDRRGRLGIYGQLRDATAFYHKDFYLRGMARPGTPQNPLDHGIARYKTWRLPSSAGFHFQTPEGREELAQAKDQIPDFQFRAEYECEVLENPEALIPLYQLQRVTHGAVMLAPKQDEFQPVIIGLDLGRTTDPSAYTILDIRTGAVLQSARLPLGMEHAQQARRMAGIAREWNNATLVIDSTGGATGGKHEPDSFVKLYRDAIPNLRPVFFNPKMKYEMVSHLALQIQQQRISIPATCEELISEMTNYTARYQGYWRFEGPSGHGDDMFISLALAEWGRKCGWAATGRSTGALADLLH